MTTYQGKTYELVELFENIIAHLAAGLFHKAKEKEK